LSSQEELSKIKQANRRRVFAEDGLEIREQPTYFGYGASADGRVWSKWENGPNSSPRGRWKLFNPTRNRSGYWQLFFRSKGLRTTYLAPFVLECWIGLRPEGHEAAQENGNKDHNCLDNLSWKTHLENEKDKIRHGTSQHGQRNKQAKLTNAEAETLIWLKKEIGISPKILSRIFRIHYVHVYAVASGRRRGNQ
jgi:hypothetical protein